MSESNAQERRQRLPIPPEKRKSLRLWATGAREEILSPFIPDYAAAVTRGRSAERKLLRRILVIFFSRVHWSLPDWEQPVLDPNWSADSVIMPEQLTPEVQAFKDARLRELGKRIRRWFRYRDPYARMVIRLSGYAPPRKARQAFQQYMVECYRSDVAPMVQLRWAQKQQQDPAYINVRPRAGFRAAVAKEMFGALSRLEQQGYAERAKVLAAAEKAAFENALREAPSMTPEARLAALNRLPDFIAPILQEIYNVTGCHSTLIVGGPHPEFGGQITTTHISFGRSLNAGHSHWAEYDPLRFERDVLGFYVDFLKTTYTERDCVAAALPNQPARTKPGTSMGTADEDSDADTSPNIDSESDSEDEEISDLESDTELNRSKKRRRHGQNAPPPPHPRTSFPVTSAVSNSSPAGMPRLPMIPLISMHSQSQNGVTNEFTFSSATQSNQNSVMNYPSVTQSAHVTESLTMGSTWLPSSTLTAPAPAPAPAPALDFAKKPLFFPSPSPSPSRSSSPSLHGDATTFAASMDPNPTYANSFAPAFLPQSTSPPFTSISATTPPSNSSNAYAYSDSFTPFNEAPQTSSSSWHEPFFRPNEATSRGLSSGSSLASSSSLSNALTLPTSAAQPRATIASRVALQAILEHESMPPSVPEKPVFPSSVSPPSTLPPSSSSSVVSPVAAATKTKTVEPRRRTRKATLQDHDMTQPPPCPSNAKEWFQRALDRVTKPPHFSTTAMFSLPSTGRPNILTRWKRSNPDKAPKVENIPAFKAEYTAWWDSMQPQWRKRTADSLGWQTSGNYGGGADWGDLYTWGSDGFVYIVSALYIWGCEVHGTAEEADWVVSTEDACWMMEGMATYYEEFNWNK
ncbi:hypothetical protein MIND_01101200 [Mycena indigotica]|uniref:Uncharacterized protein n=1 Tax=Mycena indigotica TaxID=2126181 RepID=A0A8H6S9S7_9AGAR|nr:uncharacterized protein MIND_01101200 [Mycena indigotica]KAF7295611.1 hypothetical protein MIND_01101200 [Mycena indigotica]